MSERLFSILECIFDFIEHLMFIRKIKRGAALLDKKNEFWWEKINLKDLRFDTPFWGREVPNDILGQLYGNHYDGLRALFGPDASLECKQARTHGFTCGRDMRFGLCTQWTKFIKHRLATRIHDK